MPIIGSYEQASGLSIDDTSFLGQRHDADEGFVPEHSECWVLGIKRTGGPQPFDVRAVAGTLGWYTGLWRSPAGRTYVTASSGQVVSNPDLWDPGAPWDDNQLGVPLIGIWGLDDRCIFAWGARWQKEYKVFRFDGTRWSELPSPGFDVRAMHGLAPDLVQAVGVGGRMARWDGSRWTEPSSPVGENLTAVFMAAPDEIYAVGAAGAVLEGSTHGWGVITTAPLGQLGMPLHAVAKFRGELLIGARAQGLLRRVGTTGELEVEALSQKRGGMVADRANTALPSAAPRESIGPRDVGAVRGPSASRAAAASRPGSPPALRDCYEATAKVNEHLSVFAPSAVSLIRAPAGEKSARSLPRGRGSPEHIACRMNRVPRFQTNTPSLVYRESAFQPLEHSPSTFEAPGSWVFEQCM